MGQIGSQAEAQLLCALPKIFRALLMLRAEVPHPKGESLVAPSSPTHCREVQGLNKSGGQAAPRSLSPCRWHWLPAQPGDLPQCPRGQSKLLAIAPCPSNVSHSLCKACGRNRLAACHAVHCCSLHRCQGGGGCSGTHRESTHLPCPSPAWGNWLQSWSTRELRCGAGAGCGQCHWAC